MKNPAVEILIAIPIYNMVNKTQYDKIELQTKAQSDRNSWNLTHARRNLSARDAVEDKESPNSCEDDTSSESSDSQDSDDSSTYVEESFEVMFVPEEEIQQLN